MFSAQDTIASFDPELFAAMEAERGRQEDHIELIASENYASPRVLEACQEARYHLRQRNVKRIYEAIRLYRLATEWGPSYAPGS